MKQIDFLICWNMVNFAVVNQIDIMFWDLF